jgi:hypothetical protein
MRDIKMTDQALEHFKRVYDSKMHAYWAYSQTGAVGDRKDRKLLFRGVIMLLKSDAELPHLLRGEGRWE